MANATPTLAQDIEAQPLEHQDMANRSGIHAGTSAGDGESHAAPTALGFNAHGGVGCISVVANIAPRLCAEFQEATLAGDYARALAYQDRLMPLHTHLFAETNPSPAKYALARLGQRPAGVDVFQPRQSLEFGEA